MYLYAITDQPETPVPDELGLGDTSLLNLPYQDIAAVASPLTMANVSLTEANLWRHEAVVEALMADRTVLPVRFGTVLANEGAVQAVLATHYADFVASLDRVRGRVELGLRVLWIFDPSAPLRTGFGFSILDCRESAIENRQSKIENPSGRAYLLARLEEQRRLRAWRQQAEALAAELHVSLERLAAQSTRQVLLTPRLLLTAAYLIERDRVETFREAVEALSETHPALRFLCTGPWPAYNFVTTTNSIADCQIENRKSKTCPERSRRIENHTDGREDTV